MLVPLTITQLGSAAEALRKREPEADREQAAERGELRELSHDRRQLRQREVRPALGGAK